MERELRKIKAILEKAIVEDPGRCPECGREADGRGYGVLKCSRCGITWGPEEGYEYADVNEVRKAIDMLEELIKEVKKWK